jgi:hypothetical protein
MDGLCNIDLIKRSVLNIPYVDAELNPIQPHGKLGTAVPSVFKRVNIQFTRLRCGDHGDRLSGHDFSILRARCSALSVSTIFRFALRGHPRNILAT